MAYAVNWLTKLVTVPLGDLTLVSGINYTLNVSAAHEEFRRLEWEFVDGLWAAHIIEFVDSQLLSGITYAPIVKMVNGYTWEIDASNINVSLTGPNTNLLDTYIPSMSVSILVNNSGGKIVTGSGLSVAEQAQLRELHANEGLETGNPMTVTPTSRATDDATVDLALTGDGVTSTTVTRQ